MTFIYNFHLSNFIFEIIYLITFSEFLSIIYIIFKLSILSNHAKHPKKLVLCYTLLFSILSLLDIANLYIIKFFIFI